jgi:DNA-binding NarL/FixJ family response regulator
MVIGENIRIVLADDHAPMRAELRAAFEAGNCEVCGEAASADEAIQLVVQHQPDVALLDIHMPGNGIYAAQVISRRMPNTAIVMLTQSKEHDDLFDSLRAGASGYLLKDTDPALLPGMLGRVLAGEPALPPGVAQRILEEFRAPARGHFVRKSFAAAALSAREWEVMELLSYGKATDEVARRLFLSPTTVRVHVSAVLRKLAVKDRESAFRLLRD